MVINALGKYSGHKSSIYTVIEYDDDHFLSVGGDGYVVKWKITGSDYDGQVIAYVDAKIFSICNLEDGILTIGDMNGHVYWVDTWKNETLKNIQHHRKGVFTILLYNGYLYTGGGSGMITKWDIQKMVPIESTQVCSSSIRKIIELDSCHLLVGCSDGNVYEVNTDDMSVHKRYENAHENSVFSLMKDDSFLFTGGRDAHINKYNMLTNKLEFRIPAHWFTVNDIVNIDGSRYMASASRDKRIRIWNKKSLEVVQSIDVQNGGHINSVNSLLYLPNHKILLSASDDRSISRFYIDS